MQVEELINIISNIKKSKYEAQSIEIRSTNEGYPRLYNTLSSFSNQDVGGIIIFGIDKQKDYEIVGVVGPQALQESVTELCKQMEPVIHPLFTVCEIEGKIIVSAEIPGIEIYERPVYYKGVGRTKGSYVRVGESDEPMSEYEIHSYEAFRKRIRDDLRTIDEEDFSFIYEERLDNYIKSVKKERKNLADNVTQEELFRLMGIKRGNSPTLAGILTFSKYPQAYFPQLCITAIALPGTEKGEVGPDNERFIDNKRITGSIPDMLDEAVEFVRKNSRTKTIIDENGHRKDKAEYPIIAVREAILNALVHRDYSIYSENVPIRIEMYRDRLEIINSGGLYGKISINELGKVRPETRNTALANILELLNITENRYSGIPTMYSELKNSGLPAPTFSIVHGEFKVVMKNSLYSNIQPLNDSLLDFCQTPRSRDEIIRFVGKSKNYVISRVVLPLVKSGKLELTIPDKPKSYNQKFFTKN